MRKRKSSSVIRNAAKSCISYPLGWWCLQSKASGAVTEWHNNWRWWWTFSLFFSWKKRWRRRKKKGKKRLFFPALGQANSLTCDIVVILFANKNKKDTLFFSWLENIKKATFFNQIIQQKEQRKKKQKRRQSPQIMQPNSIWNNN